MIQYERRRGDGMNVFEIVGRLYTEKDTKWIDQITPEDLVATKGPVLLTKFIGMNPKLTWQLPILVDYSMVLDTKQFLFVAWALIPKSPSAPYCKYLKPPEEDIEFDFIWEKLRKVMEIGGNDFKHSKKRLLVELKTNMRQWFFDFGVDKKYWKKYGLDYHNPTIKPVGLGAWF